MNQRRMHLREAHIGEERRAGLGIALDECSRARRDLLVEQRSGLDVEVGHCARRGALHALPDFRHGIARLREQRIRAVRRLVRSVPNAEPLIEPLIRRQPSLDVADVPFAEGAGRVASFGEQIAERDLPRRESVVTLARQRHAAVAGANRQATRQDRRTRRRALRFDVVVPEAQSLRRKPIDARRGSKAAIAAYVSPADVVAKNENDVGLALGHVSFSTAAPSLPGCAPPARCSDRRPGRRRPDRSAPSSPCR